MDDGLKRARAAAKRTPQRFYFFLRNGPIAGCTVCKSPKLPEGDFKIVEYAWGGGGYTVLWFVDADNFTVDERQEAYRQYGLAQMENRHGEQV